MNARKTAGSDLALGAGSVGSRPWLLHMHSFGARFGVGVVALSRCGVRLQREKIIRWKPGFGADMRLLTTRFFGLYLFDMLETCLDSQINSQSTHFWIIHKLS